MISMCSYVLLCTYVVNYAVPLQIVAVVKKFLPHSYIEAHSNT